MEAVELCRRSQEAGADGLLVVTPYYNKGNNEGVIRHFKMVAECVDIPVILYNVPSRTGMNLPVEVVEELSKVENIVGIKEASGNISYVAEISRRCSEEFAIYSGNDDMIVPVLSLGGKGVISVVANIEPKKTHNIVADYRIPAAIRYPVHISQEDREGGVHLHIGQNIEQGADHKYQVDLVFGYLEVAFDNFPDRFFRDRLISYLGFLLGLGFRNKQEDDKRCNGTRDHIDDK